MINLLVFSVGEKHYTENVHQVSDGAQEAGLAGAMLVLDGGQANVAPEGGGEWLADRRRSTDWLLVHFPQHAPAGL